MSQICILNRYILISYKQIAQRNKSDTEKQMISMNTGATLLLLY